MDTDLFAHVMGDCRGGALRFCDQDGRGYRIQRVHGPARCADGRRLRDGQELCELFDAHSDKLLALFTPATARAHIELHPEHFQSVGMTAVLAGDQLELLKRWLER